MEIVNAFQLLLTATSVMAEMEEALAEIEAAEQDYGWVRPGVQVVAFDEARLSTLPNLPLRARIMTVERIEEVLVHLSDPAEPPFGLFTQASLAQRAGETLCRRFIKADSDNARSILLSDRIDTEIEKTKAAFQAFIDTPKGATARAARAQVDKMLGMVP